MCSLVYGKGFIALYLFIFVSRLIYCHYLRKVPLIHSRMQWIKYSSPGQIIITLINLSPLFITTQTPPAAQKNDTLCWWAIEQNTLHLLPLQGEISAPWGLHTLFPSKQGMLSLCYSPFPFQKKPPNTFAVVVIKSSRIHGGGGGRTDHHVISPPPKYMLFLSPHFSLF